MIFEDFIKEERVIIGEKDFQKAKALIKMSKKNFQTAEKLEIDKITASTVLSILYESLREIVEAICLTKGYKVCSHEAFTAYLKKINEDSTAEKFDRLRKLRNRVHYYGKPVSTETAVNAKQEVKKLNYYLTDKHLKNL